MATEDTMTHNVPMDGPTLGRQVLSRCLLWVARSQASGDPSCEECRRLNAEDAATLASLQETEYHPSPSEKHDRLRGYKPRRGTR